MISYTRGNILKDQADAIINPVNTVGVMGKGLALQFKQAYPENFYAYKAACEKKQLTVGSLLVIATHSITPPYFIINFPTKVHWRGKSKIEYIQTGLQELIRTIQQLHISSVAIPPLGCGLGGLPWQMVSNELTSVLATAPQITWRIYPPDLSDDNHQA